MTWFLLVAAALGAPIALPPGESPAEWSSALGRAGLEPGIPGSGEGVRVVVVSAGWELIVRDEHGEERRATVPVPRTPAARESVAALAASLLHPAPEISSLPLPELPPLPVTTTPTPSHSPSTSTSPPPSPAPAPALAKPAPPPALPYEPPPALPYEVPRVVASAPPPPLDARVAIVDPSPRFFAGGGLGFRFRNEVRAMTVLSGSAGWIPFGLPVRLGGGVELAPFPAAMQQLPDEGGARKMSAYDGKLLAAWSPGPFELGGTIGLSVRTQHDPTASPPPATMIPTAGAILAYRVPTVPIRFAFTGDVDLAATDLYYPETTPRGRLSRLAWGLSASVWTSGGSLSERGSTAGGLVPR